MTHSPFVLRSKVCEVVAVASDFNPEVKKLSASEASLGGLWALPTHLPFKGNGLLQFCVGSRLFLFVKNFQHSLRYIAIWRRSSMGALIKTEHMAIKHQ